MKKEIDAYIVERNKTLNKIKYLYLVFFVIIIANILYFLLFQSHNLAVNPYNPRIKQIEAETVRGDIVDKNGVILAQTIKTDGIYQRVYPYNELYAHIVGYATRGKTGIEAYSNMSLLKSDSSFLKRLGADLTQKQLVSNRVVTTLDNNLQSKAYELLGDKKGAVVALDPSTGKVLCMVSKPSFNPNYIVEEWETLSSDEENSPFINRATQGAYPPGSTFKLIAAMAYLKAYPDTPFEYTCFGEDYYHNKIIHCYRNKAHGKVDLKEALAVSCNTAFAKIGELVPVETFNIVANEMLFNQPLPFNFPYRSSSFYLPSDANEALIAETVIGQGDTLISPLHNALITATIANGGIMMAPYVIDRIENSEGELVEKYLPNMHEQLLEPAITKMMTDYMEAVVIDGTAKAIALDGISIAGKTGSAENPIGDAHAWFVGFAPVNQPKIVISVIVENAGSGSKNAVPIAKELFDVYLKGNQ